MNAEDNLNNTSTFTNNGSVVFDSTAPIVTLAAPANNSATNDTTPTFTGTAGQLVASSTTSADSTTVTVKIYSGATTGGTLVQTLTTTESGGNWTVTPTTGLTPNAQYTAQASQSDGAGNTGTSSANTFVIDTTAPVVTVTSPANSSATNDTTPTFTGTAGQLTANATQSADLAAVTVKIYSGATTGGTLVQTLSTTESGGTWSATPTTALSANAEYTVQASQSDGAGNTGVSSPSAFVIDTTAPVVTLTGPANGSTTNDITPTLAGAAGQVAASSTTSADSTTVTVKIYAGATATGTPVQTLTTTESGGTWSATPTTALPANAQYTAQASQSDGAGNTGTSSASTFVIDTTAPIVTLTSPSNNSTTSDTTPTFTGPGPTHRQHDPKRRSLNCHGLCMLRVAELVWSLGSKPRGEAHDHRVGWVVVGDVAVVDGQLHLHSGGKPIRRSGECRDVIGQRRQHRDGSRDHERELHDLHDRHGWKLHGHHHRLPRTDV